MSYTYDPNVHQLLDDWYISAHKHDFIQDDPILIPHRYSSLQDVEISAFWTSILAWGQRRTIINKAVELFDLMDNRPYDFIINHTESDLKRFENFKHRTFQYTDTLYFLDFFKRYYNTYPSMQSHFVQYANIKDGIAAWHDLFFDVDYAPSRTKKHIATPIRKSACKRINMFLRWMVRKNSPVDFGLWTDIDSSLLMMPMDVHVRRVAGKLGLLTRSQNDWKAVEELTANLRVYDPQDPVKYDYALFGAGVGGMI